MFSMRSSRDESFFRTLAFKTYHTTMPPILLEELSYMLKHSHQPWPFVAFFHFDGGEIAVGGLTERNFTFVSATLGPVAEDQMTRAAGPRGQNRVQVICILSAIAKKRRATHLFAIPKPKGLRAALVALANSGEVPPGVVEVAELRGVPAVVNKIEAMAKGRDFGWLDSE
ncbi:hypothetical protein FB45DRAFT_1031985 [Roridomyces roridus]|uniref:Uncharacterized protein n=1 Tax=Roridomyces roridus TaxID=1738132 RepID=A0AAD7BIK1_9AGAR|nr:hypothetical protein FB45DRAFT_1031985 [Roridomyces roridus]